jgi:hypothetical protein
MNVLRDVLRSLGRYLLGGFVLFLAGWICLFLLVVTFESCS